MNNVVLFQRNLEDGLSATDQDRLDRAFEELRLKGYTALEGGCCPGCCWGAVERSGGNPERAVHYNDQGLDDAFGPLELPPDWQARLDGAADEDEAEHIFDEACDQELWVRPTTLEDSLYLEWTGSAREIVAVLRSHGLNAVWKGDPGLNIEIRPRQARRREKRDASSATQPAVAATGPGFREIQKAPIPYPQKSADRSVRGD